MNRYTIIRFHENYFNVTIKRNVTLEEAQSHCKDPETSSRTCTKPENIALTEKYGPWFDGYEEDHSWRWGK